MSPFFDAHVHPPVPALLDGPFAPYLDGLQTATGRAVRTMTGAELADLYRDCGGRAALLGWDLETRDNRRPFSSQDVAQIVADAPDVFVGFGAVDPAKGARAVAQVHEAARLGMKGIAVHPAAQGIGPANRLSSSVWEAAADYGLVCLIHTGTTRLGFGSPGGSGVELTAGNPMHADTIAARLPDLTVILAHTGPLWRSEALAVAAHKANVYLCPTGTSPDEWPELVGAAAGAVRGRILFGSGFPFSDPEDLAKEWHASAMPRDAVERALFENATELFG